MKIYIVTISWDYEGGKICGVFSNKKHANKIRDNLKAGDRGDSQEVITLILNKELNRDQEVTI